MAAILSLKRFASFNVTKHKRMYKVNDADLFVTKFKPNRLQIDHFHKKKKLFLFISRTKIFTTHWVEIMWKQRQPVFAQWVGFENDCNTSSMFVIDKTLWQQYYCTKTCIFQNFKNTTIKFLETGLSTA